MRYKAIGVYSLLAYFNQLSNVLINIAFIRTLPLSILGEVTLARVWMQLVDYSHLGLRFALDRYVPVWDEKKSKDLLWLCIGTTSVTTTLIVCFALSLVSHKLLVLAFIVWGYSVSLTNILKSFYRASGQTRKMLFIYIVCPTIPVTLQACVAFFFDFTWFLVITVMIYLSILVYLFFRWRMRNSVQTTDIRNTWRSVHKSSASLFVNAIIIFFSFAIDRVMLSYFGTKQQLGEYSIILFGFSLLLTAPSTLAEFVFPKVVSTVARTGRIFFPREILVIAVPTFSFVALSSVLVPYVIETFTNYSSLTGMIQLILLGVLPYSVIPVLYHTMSALDLRRYLMVAASVALLVYTLVLFVGGIYANNILLFYTIARASYGYILLVCYICLLSIYGRRKL